MPLEAPVMIATLLANDMPHKPPTITNEKRITTEYTKVTKKEKETTTRELDEVDCSFLAGYLHSVIVRFFTRFLVLVLFFSFLSCILW
jgi:hypothetical protein